MVFQKSKESERILKEEILKAEIKDSSVVLLLRLLKTSGQYLLKTKTLLLRWTMPNSIELYKIAEKEQKFDSLEKAEEEFNTLRTMWKLQNL